MSVASTDDPLAGLLSCRDAGQALPRTRRVVVRINELLASIESDMVDLSDRTRGPGAGLHLSLQRRAATGALALRWRDAQNRTLSADAWADRVARLPPEAGRWYAEINAKSRWLNARERLARHTRQVLRELSAESEY
jgi:hypothetical protein